MITIYALLDDDQVRFIGKTTQTDLDGKLKQHLHDALVMPQKFPWINDLWKRGGSPRIKKIFSCNDNEVEFYERLFIDHFKFFTALRFANVNSIISRGKMQEINE